MSIAALSPLHAPIMLQMQSIAMTKKINSVSPRLFSSLPEEGRLRTFRLNSIMDIKPSKLFHVVTDVNEYSKFVPYVAKSIILSPDQIFPPGQRSKVSHSPISVLEPLNSMEKATIFKKVCYSTPSQTLTASTQGIPPSHPLPFISPHSNSKQHSTLDLRQRSRTSTPH